MSTESQTVTDTSTHTKSFWKAASHHAAKGVIAAINFDGSRSNNIAKVAILTIAGVVALVAGAFVVVALVADAVAIGNAVAIGVSVGFGIAVSVGVAGGTIAVDVDTAANMVSKITKEHANDISPTLKNTFNKIAYHGLWVVPLLGVAATLSAALPLFEQPHAAPHPPIPMAAKFYKVSGPANNNCQLEEATPSANGKRVFELQGNCKFEPSKFEAN